MVAAGILLFGALAFMSLAASNIAFQADVQNQTEIHKAMEDVKTLVKDPKMCQEAFRKSDDEFKFPALGEPPYKPAPFSFDSLKIDDDTVLKMGDPVGTDLTLTELKLEDVLPPEKVTGTSTVVRWMRVKAVAKSERTKLNLAPRVSSLLRITHDDVLNAPILSCGSQGSESATDVDCAAAGGTSDGTGCYLPWMKDSEMVDTDTYRLRLLYPNPTATTVLPPVVCPRLYVNGCSSIQNDYNSVQPCGYRLPDFFDTTVNMVTVEGHEYMMVMYKQLGDACSKFCKRDGKYTAGRFANCDDSTFTNGDGSVNTLTRTRPRPLNQWSRITCECFY